VSGSDYDAADNSRRSYEVGIEALRLKLEAFPCERIRDCKLYLGDCRELLPLLSTFDAVVTDPPYGIGAGTGIGKVTKEGSDFRRAGQWDDEPPAATLLSAVLAKSRWAIIWGGNYVQLPPTRRNRTPLKGQAGTRHDKPCSWQGWPRVVAGRSTSCGARLPHAPVHRTFGAYRGLARGTPAAALARP
jgi:hypothetical protein